MAIAASGLDEPPDSPAPCAPSWPVGAVRLPCSAGARCRTVLCHRRTLEYARGRRRIRWAAATAPAPGPRRFAAGRPIMRRSARAPRRPRAPSPQRRPRWRRWRSQRAARWRQLRLRWRRRRKRRASWLSEVTVVAWSSSEACDGGRLIALGAQHYRRTCGREPNFSAGIVVVAMDLAPETCTRGQAGYQW